LLVEDASLAGAGVELPGDGADRATVPEVRVRVGAFRAQRRLPGATAGLGDGAATAAGHPSLLAAFAPGLAGGPGPVAERSQPADAALRGDSRPTVLAAWAVGQSVRDGLASAAADAFLQVRGLSDHTVRTQRPPLGVAGGGLSRGAAAEAGDGRVGGEAGPADPLAELGRPGLDEFVDEPRGCRGGSFVTGAGQQVGTSDDGPGQATLSGGPDGGSPECGQDRSVAEGGIEACDELGEFLERIAVGVRAVLAAGVAVTVPADDASLPVTSRADCGLVEAR
jgi:hypothetical protein